MPPPNRSVPHTGWSDEHEDDEVGKTEDYGDPLWERPRGMNNARFVPRIGITGSVQALNQAFLITVVARLVAAGRSPLVITFDTDRWEDLTHLRSALTGILDAARIVGISTEHTPEHALASAVARELIARFADADTLLYAGNATAAKLVWDPTLVHYVIGIRDEMDATPDLHPTDLRILHRIAGAASLADTQMPRSDSPTVVADCIGGQGLDVAFAILWDEVLS